MLRSTVESVRSRCMRDTGSLSARWRSTLLARPRLPFGVLEVDRIDLVRA